MSLLFSFLALISSTLSRKFIFCLIIIPLLLFVWVISFAISFAGSCTSASLVIVFSSLPVCFSRNVGKPDSLPPSGRATCYWWPAPFGDIANGGTATAVLESPTWSLWWPAITVLFTYSFGVFTKWSPALTYCSCEGLILSKEFYWTSFDCFVSMRLWLSLSSISSRLISDWLET